jgi:hypothetical protein
MMYLMLCQVMLGIVTLLGGHIKSSMLCQEMLICKSGAMKILKYNNQFKLILCEPVIIILSGIINRCD